ncbi:HMG-Y-related protein A-like [Solanum tuberosum]|uniref:High mobility group family n=1 Tax=Solanum tuberosum TaxID=4113 RepID=M1A5Z7_SOLTU|nr:PREDICTED: HMG-Y-related protein A-like [Solanum tuberosum]
MDKLREGIVKMSNSEPNAPLSEAQNSILQQHLDRLMSGLQTTPDHPPYAWMIEKALQELDEEGGSNEDSISEFIMKNNDSLPRAHTTMLKHHLEKMCERGEIVMIDGGRFSLPGDSKNSNPTRKGKSKKRGSSSNTQKKQQQKEKEEDPRHVVHLEQPKKQGRGRPAKNKEDGGKKGDGTTSALATKEPEDKREGALKGQEDVDDPDAVLLKDLRCKMMKD